MSLSSTLTLPLIWPLRFISKVYRLQESKWLESAGSEFKSNLRILLVAWAWAGHLTLFASKKKNLQAHKSSTERVFRGHLFQSSILQKKTSDLFKVIEKRFEHADSYKRQCSFHYTIPAILISQNKLHFSAPQTLYSTWLTSLRYYYHISLYCSTCTVHRDICK